MDFITEIITEFITELFDVLLCFPGAFIRWMVTGRKRSYASLLEDGGNSFVTIIAGLMLFGIITLCKHYL